jgi:hypothetical protein
METEIENIAYSGKPISGTDLDMTHVYRVMTQNPENIKPLESAAGDQPQYMGTAGNNSVSAATDGPGQAAESQQEVTGLNSAGN